MHVLMLVLAQCGLSRSRQETGGRSALLTSKLSYARRSCSQSRLNPSMATLSNFVSVVTAHLDRVASMHLVTSRRRNPTARWLSSEAIASKRRRRRLERRWRRTSLHADRVAYHMAYRAANKFIVQSHRSYVRQCLNSAYSCSRWKTVRELLHTSDRDYTSSDFDNSRLCTTFSDLFTAKIDRLRQTLQLHPVISSFKCSFDDPPYCGTVLTTLSEISPVEVTKVISSLKVSSSRNDFIPIPVIKACSDVFSEMFLTLLIFPSLVASFLQHLNSSHHSSSKKTWT
jgi:hypothetical protein